MTAPTTGDPLVDVMLVAVVLLAAVVVWVGERQNRRDERRWQELRAKAIRELLTDEDRGGSS